MQFLVLNDYNQKAFDKDSFLTQSYTFRIFKSYY
jgi:hypothetical protein